MAGYVVILEARAERELWRLPLPVRQALQAALRELEVDPHRPRPGCDIRSLAGGRGLRALRVGRYRMAFLVDEAMRRVFITRVGHRRNVYGR